MESKQMTWDETVDVVIVGSGFAGLAAAEEAAKTCSKVLVLEKMRYTGGNSRIAGGGYCCWGSKLKLREELGLGEDSWELHAQDTLAAGGGYADPALVEVLAKEAPMGLDLLVDAGVPFRKSLPRIGGHSAYRSYQIACTGAETMDKLTAYCTRSGNVGIRTETAVERLVRAASPAVPADPADPADPAPVEGVVTVDAQGARRAIRATRGVIVASGGYARDVALRCAHKPALTDAYSCTNHKGATGEMIRAAQAVGADTVHMEFLQLYPCANPETGGIDQAAFLCYSGTGYGLIYVNARGERFVNELASREVVSNAQVRGAGRPTYAVLNDEIFAKLGIGFGDIARMMQSGRALCASSLEGLAAVAGFDADAFAASVEEHNAAISRGRQAAFGKDTGSAMVPLKTGNFYCIAQWPSVHYCMGGLRIDARARVLDAYGEPIPGLFAAGECCGGVHGIDRLGGNGIAECFVFGRRAGMLGAC